MCILPTCVSVYAQTLKGCGGVQGQGQGRQMVSDRENDICLISVDGNIRWCIEPSESISEICLFSLVVGSFQHYHFCFFMRRHILHALDALLCYFTHIGYSAEMVLAWHRMTLFLFIAASHWNGRATYVRSSTLRIAYSLSFCPSQYLGWTIESTVLLACTALGKWKIVRFKYYEP